MSKCPKYTEIKHFWYQNVRNTLKQITSDVKMSEIHWNKTLLMSKCPKYTEIKHFWCQNVRKSVLLQFISDILTSEVFYFSLFRTFWHQKCFISVYFGHFDIRSVLFQCISDILTSEVFYFSVFWTFWNQECFISVYFGHFEIRSVLFQCISRNKTLLMSKCPKYTEIKHFWCQNVQNTLK
jgi:hypothetical protein